MTNNTSNASTGSADSAANNALSWWETAVIYQIYPRSYQDSNDDGIRTSRILALTLYGSARFLKVRKRILVMTFQTTATSILNMERWTISMSCLLRPMVLV